MEHNLATVHEAIAEAVGDRDCIVQGDKRLSWAQVTERTRRLANYLSSQGLGVHKERSQLSGWESGQDHLGLYLFNGNEYLEGMLGGYKARVAPFNVNYRYVEEELLYLLKDAQCTAIIYHSTLAPTLQAIRSQLPDLKVLLQVPDESGNDLLDGAVEYEEALASASPERPDLEWSPDDLYILYTGGTTGMPKGVLWRQADIFMAAMGGTEGEVSEFVERAKTGGGVILATPPFMHGAAHWLAFNGWSGGNTIAIQAKPRTLDPDDIWSTCEREKVGTLLLVGDAFGRPLADQLSKQAYNLESLRIIVSGGAPLNATIKQEIVDALPAVMIADVVGSSETGSQGTHVSSKMGGVSTGTFMPGPSTFALSEDLTRVLKPGDEETGWLAQTGRVPLGYLGDQKKTEATFPVVDGTRYSVPGDRVRLKEDGSLELFGRDSVTINSGGEKIFAEEVEAALRHHPSVFDVVVAGRPSERWGSEVVAIVQLREGAAQDEGSLLDEAGKHVARYKLPKAFVFRDEIVRSPSGKADYRWAKAQATEA